MNVKKVILKILIFTSSFLVLLVAIVTIQYKFKSNPKRVKQYTVSNPYITDKTLIGAHRSGAGIMPEETMMAFKNCINNSSFKVDIFEFDLHITADNQLVLLHDDVLDRTSDSEEVFGEKEIKIETLTLAELKKLNMGYKFVAADGTYPYRDLKSEDLRIAQLDEVLDYLTQQGDFYYIVEIKNSGENGKEACRLFCEDIIQRNLVNRVILGSFHAEVCEYAEQNFPQIARSASKKEVVSTVMAYFLGNRNFNPDFEVLIIPYGDYREDYFINAGTAGFLNFAHKNNLAVVYWTINRDKDIKYLLNLGSDAILTDYPDKAYEKRLKK